MLVSRLESTHNIRLINCLMTSHRLNTCKVDSMKSSLERIFNMMLRALETGPECVHTIFDLMICMSQLPPALTESGQQRCATDPVRRVWKDLPHLGRSLGAEWSGKSIHIVRKDRSPDKVASRQANSTNPLRISKRVDRTPDALRRKAV